MEVNLRKILSNELLEKRAKLSYKYIENEDTWNLIFRTCNNPELKFKDTYKILLGLVSITIRICGVLIILLSEVWWAPLVIFSFSFPLFILAIKSGKATYETNRDVSKYKRKYEYLGEILTGRESVEERTLFGFSDIINKKWHAEYEATRKLTYKTELKWFIKMKAGSIITSLISIFTIFVLINPLLSGVITVGMFISLVNAIFALVQLMSWQLSYLADELASNLEYLKDLTDFVNLEECNDYIAKPSPEPIKFKKLEFKNVKFKYPQTENYILDGMSFTIETGKHYAFVGANGAGKSTITKLITGLYTEYEGEILINGKNLREYTQSEIKSFCSVVYQDFAKYSISLKDNISIGRINEIKKNSNDDPIYNAISMMGLNNLVQSLNQGIDTYLGKIKADGVDISSGQWQRVAMARAIVNPGNLKILDEPTASLDPISESNIYQNFEEISKNSTTIFISHRLGSTKLADEIFVVGNGYVLEQGNHNELINLKGIYKEMYESQKGWYSYEI
jgi:ABC-type multidrug transport system fused ATPase/permease subunit